MSKAYLFLEFKLIWMEKSVFVSLKDRVYLPGVPLQPQEIKEIHILEEELKKKYPSITSSELIKLISAKTKLDVRTVPGYLNKNSTVNIGGNRKKHNVDVIEYIKNLIEQKPDTYLREIQAKVETDLNIKRSLTTIHRYLTRDLNFTHQKLVRFAYYRTLARVQELRNSFREKVKLNHPWAYVFVDESHFDSKCFHRKSGYGPKGQRTPTFNHKLSSKTWSLLACISAFKVIYYEIIETTDCGINAERFGQFLRNMLLFVPDAATMILDNCRIHKTSDIIGIMEALDTNYLFLGPYSPEMNPIEYFFSFIKLKVKDNYYDNVIDTIERAIDQVTQRHLKGWINLSKKYWDSNEM